MASTTLHHFLLTFFLLASFIVISDQSSAPSKPTALVLPVQKDGATNLHVANIHKRTPLMSVPFVIDLNGLVLWVNCDQHYLSSTYNAPFCNSTQCSRANSHYCHKCPSAARPGCHNNTCGIITTNPVTQRSAVGELAQDVLSIQSIQGSNNTGPMITVPQFLFACAPSMLLQGPLPKNVQGIAGLGHSPIALPTQLASHFGFPQQFSLCLSYSTTKNGVIFFGSDVPHYNMLIPSINTYTPLTISPQGEYFIQVSSININQKPIPLKTKQAFLGTMISTTIPYTTLEHSLFTTFTQFFAHQLSKVPQVKQVPPFGLCFNSKSLSNTGTGLGVPGIDFVLQNRSVVWRILSANSMVQPRPGVACLAFVDGGSKPRASIVIGGYQLEENLLQFDLGRSRLGFSSSLLLQRTSCANFNFTSNP